VSRAGPFLGVLLLTVLGAVMAVATVSAEDPPPVPAVTETVVQEVLVVQRIRGRGVHYWHHRAKTNYREMRQYRRRVRELRREVLRRWNYPQLIAVAAWTYGVDVATLERKARCESENFTDFYNESSGASGVMQFLPSTWATTPYRRFSIFDPFTNVLAGAWMHTARVGRGGEWVCR
jgi:hypothetical protein